jgi:energy-converting hydrogenase Eha subunit H
MHWAILFFGILLLVPALRHIQLVGETITSGNMEMRIERCTMGFHNNPNNLLLINSAVFIIDFALPLILCTSLAVYLRHFRQKNQQLVGAQDSKIQKMLLIICAIYFICFLPHFFAVALILFAKSLSFELYGSTATTIADTALIFTWIPPV